MKFGCCTTMENYDALCRMGYDYIELPGVYVSKLTDAQVDEAAKRIKDAGVPCAGYNAYCNQEVPIVGPNFDAKVVEAYAKKMCERGAKLGIKNIGVGSPLARKLPEGFDMALADKQCSEFLTITAKEAEKYGMQVLFESLNTDICNYMVHTKDALELVKKLNLPNLFIVLDFHHMLLMDEDVEDIAYVMPYVKHLHTNHVGADRSKQFLVEEETDLYRKELNAAKKCGYDGTFSVEADPSPDFETDAGRSIKIFRSL